MDTHSPVAGGLRDRFHVSALWCAARDDGRSRRGSGILRGHDSDLGTLTTG